MRVRRVCFHASFCSRFCSFFFSCSRSSARLTMSSLSFCQFLCVSVSIISTLFRDARGIIGNGIQACVPTSLYALPGGRLHYCRVLFFFHFLPSLLIFSCNNSRTICARGLSCLSASCRACSRSSGGSRTRIASVFLFCILSPYIGWIAIVYHIKQYFASPMRYMYHITRHSLG